MRSLRDDRRDKSSATTEAVRRDRRAISDCLGTFVKNYVPHEALHRTIIPKEPALIKRLTGSGD
jgi:hypothetical protein